MNGNGCWDGVGARFPASGMVRVASVVADNAGSIDVITADIDGDGDGQANFADFLILSGAFGSGVDPFTEGDITGDGAVSFADFLILSDNFGKTVDEIFAQA